MTSPSDGWRPSPELLAAYFDGECEGRDDLAKLKLRIEDWLSANPDAQQELADHRRLLHLWQQTAPPEPAAEQWEIVLSRLEPMIASRSSAKRRPDKAVPPRPRLQQIIRWGVFAATMAFLAIYLGSHFWAGQQQPTPIAEETVTPRPTSSPPPPQEDDDIFPVALAREVTIIRVEGADTQTVVVGELPLQGNLDLVGAGDVVLTKSVQAVRFIQSSSPMIWAKLDSETD